MRPANAMLVVSGGADAWAGDIVESPLVLDQRGSKPVKEVTVPVVPFQRCGTDFVGCYT